MKRMIFVWILAAGSAFADDPFASTEWLPILSPFHEAEPKPAERVPSVKDPGVAWRLAVRYLEGDGLPANREMAKNILSQVAESGNVKVAFLLFTLDCDTERELNPSMRVWKLREWAKEGYAPAQRALGLELLEGDYYVKADKPQAIRWLRLAAEGGDAEARKALAGLEIDVPKINGEEEALTLFAAAAESGSAVAQRRLGLAFLHGFGTTPDDEKAWYWLEKAATGGDAEALYRLARRGEKMDVERMRAAAEKGYPDALYRMGCDALGTDEAEATRWFEKLAETKEWGLVGRIQFAYYEALPEEKYEKGFFWNRIAAKGGYPEAMIDVANAYFEGVGTLLNPLEAFRWYRRANELHHPEGAFGMGRCYFHGEGAKRDWDEALKCFVWASERQVFAAHSFLIRDEDGWALNHGAEREFLKKAVDGDVAAMYHLATAYLEGSVCLRLHAAKDRKAGMRWLTRAAKKEHLPAQHALGERLFDAARDEEGRRWLVRAADAGYPDAMFALSHRLKEGRGVEKDEAAALNWLSRVGEAGVPGALTELMFFYEANGDVGALFGWAEKAAKEGSLKGVRLMGEAYLNGRGVAKDEPKGIDLLEKAAEAGSIQAMRVLHTHFGGWEERIRKQEAEDKCVCMCGMPGPAETRECSSWMAIRAREISKEEALK